MKEGQADIATARQRMARQHTHMSWLGERSYVRYLVAVWRSTAAFGWYSAAATLMRRLRLFRLILRVLHGLWLALQAGTTFLLLLPLLLVVLPCALLVSLVMLLGGMVEQWRMRRTVRARMTGRTVVLWVVERAALEGQDTGCFFRGQLAELAEDEHMLVVVRSPYLLKTLGPFEHTFYWTQRRERERLYIARTFGFIALRRLAECVADKVIFVA